VHKQPKQGKVPFLFIQHNTVKLLKWLKMLQVP